ncbi:uncharacterized protein TNCV_1109301 [Trichonephila clavipes]|nr:uncharacterized protein TNCV_1109301 [Trichonephila clavipes]
MIDLITTYYGNAIRQNKTCLSDMRKAVWAVYFHIRSSDEEPLHSFCPVGPNSWCKYQNQVVEGSVETFRHSNKLPVAVMDAIKPVFNDLSQPKLLQKCLGGQSGLGLNWPARSPDLSVCEYFLWRTLKFTVYQNNSHCFKELQQNICDEIAVIATVKLESAVRNLMIPLNTSQQDH